MVSAMTELCCYHVKIVVLLTNMKIYISKYLFDNKYFLNYLFVAGHKDKHFFLQFF